MSFEALEVVNMHCWSLIWLGGNCKVVDMWEIRDEELGDKRELKFAFRSCFKIHLFSMGNITWTNIQRCLKKRVKFT